MQAATQLLGENLRRFTDADGRYNAVRIAQALDWEQKDIARFLGRDPSAISRNPASQGYQNHLARLVALYERVLNLAGGDSAAVVAWLRTPILALDNAAPQAFVLDGKIDVVERLIHEYESGLAL